jgi:hypothetical protein
VGAGFLSGLLGVGGGFVIVPALRRATDLPMQTIVATSLAVIALVSGGEVVKADDALVQLEQGFKQVAADEASHASDEPGMGFCSQAGLKLVIG